MAKSLNFRSFNEGGRSVSFSPLKFRAQLDEYFKNKKESGEKLTKEELYQQIADVACVSIESVKKWRAGHNGIGDMPTIKKVADFLGVSYENIVVNSDLPQIQEIEQNFEPSFTGEKDLIIQMHKLFVDYLYWFSGPDTICYAITVLDNPDEEQKRYVANLYHFLDSIALSVSTDTYNKLRIIITQLDQIYLTYPHSYPELWKELNPIMNTEAFKMFSSSGAESLDDFICEDNLACDPQPLYHMLFEDYPEYAVEYEKNQKDDRLENKYFNILECSLPSIRDYYYEAASYTLISRECSNTLIKVMKHFFPQYFEENKSDDIS